MADTIDSRTLLKEIYNSTYDYGILTIDLKGRITTWNAGAERIIGYSAKEIIGRDQAVIYTPEDRQRDEPAQAMKIASTKGRAEDYRWHLHKDGSYFWAEGVLSLLRDDAGRHSGFLKIFRDITERKYHEAEMYRVANSDRLTGLANRYAFEIHAAELIAIALRSGRPLALHLIDLDRFKQVNDSLGHHAGDMLLQQASERMRNVLRESDFIARLGGDEFAVLQPDMATPQAGADMAERLNKVLSHPFVIDHHEVRVGGSIGIAVCPADAGDLDWLMKKADLALYRAKSGDKGKYHYFTESLDTLAHKKSDDLAALRQAIEQKEFWLEYQPMVAFSTGETLGVEAFLRCSRPELSGYRIEDMIEMAREAGLMKNLSLWVLQEACRQLRTWRNNGLPDLRICVNLCSGDLTDSNMPDIIDAIIADNALQYRNLELDITERQALDVERHGLANLNVLRSRGINIALDDFGTGQSALSYLRNLPVSTVKLDKNFLSDVPANAQNSAVVKAVMDLSHALGLEIIAEGVETNELAAFLKAYNCTALQGFLIARPLSRDDMTAWLSGGSGAIH